MLGAPGGPGWRQSLYWLIQPTDSVPAAITAAVLLVAGGITYAIRVSPPTAANEIAMSR